MEKWKIFTLSMMHLMFMSCGTDEVDNTQLTAVVGTEFNSHWTNPQTAIIIDAYGPNGIDWDKMATDKRVVAIIHKATDGLSQDSQYLARKAEAKKRGYLWGSYHLGRPGDPIQQADHYLNFTKPESDEFISLDLEAISSQFMTIDQARQFVLRIKEKTGRFPILYTNHSSTKTITSTVGADDVFSKLPLWYARFASSVSDFPNGTWNSYTLWQFSAEINCNTTGSCLYNVPGTRFDMDINVYNGTIDQLRSAWPLTSASGVNVPPVVITPPLPQNMVLMLHDGMTSGRLGKKAEVLAMQKLLVQLGYQVIADGLYGDGTKLAIAKFLNDNNLLGDGTILTQEALALMKKLASTPPPVVNPPVVNPPVVNPPVVNPPVVNPPVLQLGMITNEVTGTVKKGSCTTASCARSSTQTYNVVDINGNFCRLNADNQPLLLFPFAVFDITGKTNTGLYKVVPQSNFESFWSFTQCKGNYFVKF